MSKFYEELKRATDETSQVQPLYRGEIVKELKKRKQYNDELEIRVEGTDGIIPTFYYKEGVVHPFLVILETKLDQSFVEEVYRAEVILQIICYLKQQKEKGNELPRVAVFGSKKNCFVLPVAVIQKYIDLDIKEYKRASEAYKFNTDIVKQILNDNEVLKYSHIYQIDEEFTVEIIVDTLLKIGEDLPLTLEITEESISKIFDYFSMFVLREREKGYKGEKLALPGRIQKDLFMTMVLRPDECYLHPNKKDTAVFGEGNLRQVNRGAYIAFRNSYNFKGYSKEEEKKLTAVADRLIEDADRRRKGDFYTPSLWVDEAHKMLAENLGENWKEDYIVWDCAAGTGNLTRDYTFKRLYSSTLEEGDLKIGERYNKGKVAFQYDFLNDDVELFEELRKKKEEGKELTEEDLENSKLYKVAGGLVRGMLKGEKILFFINPPYGSAGGLKNLGGNKEDARQGQADTNISIIMKQNSIGACSRQLFAQFVYRVYIFENLFNNKVKLGLFSSPIIMTGQQFKIMRSKVLDQKYIAGFLLKASNFADVQDNWGISFTLWGERGSNDYYVGVKEIQNTIIITIRNKQLYNMDNKIMCSDWIKEEIKKIPTFDSVPLNSSLVYVKEQGLGKIAENSLGYYCSKGNMINYNNQEVYILSSSARRGQGISILPINFNRVVSNFTARRLITGQYANWVNWQDEYMIPNTEHPEYKQWEADSIVYSLFNGKSNQSSLRDIDYNGKKWDIYNHFFFMSREEMQELASGKLDRVDLNREIEDDIEEHGIEERFVYNKLKEVTLSPDAQAVLDKARELVRLSFKNREMFNMKKPEYQINTWDAGFYQIKGLLKEYHPEELKEFTELYKAFEDRMRQLVYILGFLHE